MGVDAVTVEDVRLAYAGILATDPLPLDATTPFRNIKGWDSLNGSRLLLALESTYGIDFPASEVQKLANIGELVALLNRLRAAG